MAGTGKRADHKKSLILNLKEEYFGGESLKGKPKRYRIINVDELEKKAEGKKELDLMKYKILARGEIKIPLNVKVEFISKSAKEKIEKAGGKVILFERKEEKNNEKE
jgi:ribosomal protein L15